MSNHVDVWNVCPAALRCPELGQVRINDDLVEPLAACQLGLAAGETQSRCGRCAKTSDFR